MIKLVGYTAGGLLIAVALLPLLALVAAINGWIFYTLWNWFVPVIFEGVPRIGLGAALALTLLVGIFQPSSRAKTTDKADKDWQTPLAEGILRPILTLMFGAIIRWYFF